MFDRKVEFCELNGIVRTIRREIGKLSKGERGEIPKHILRVYYYPIVYVCPSLKWNRRPGGGEGGKEGRGRRGRGGQELGARAANLH